MASAERMHGLAACASAMRSDEPMPPNARLWLARASLYADTEGRTSYGPMRYSVDCRDTEDNGRAGIAWLLGRGLVCHDHDDNGTECWRLMHYDFDAKQPAIGGYGPDRGLKRDGLPPAYGRPVDRVIGTQSGNTNFTAPTWDEVKAQISRPREEEPEW